MAGGGDLNGSEHHWVCTKCSPNFQSLAHKKKDWQNHLGFIKRQGFCQMGFHHKGNCPRPTVAVDPGPLHFALRPRPAPWPWNPLPLPQGHKSCDLSLPLLGSSKPPQTSIALAQRLGGNNPWSRRGTPQSLFIGSVFMTL